MQTSGVADGIKISKMGRNLHIIWSHPTVSGVSSCSPVAILLLFSTSGVFLQVRNFLAIRQGLLLRFLKHLLGS